MSRNKNIYDIFPAMTATILLLYVLSVFLPVKASMTGRTGFQLENIDHSIALADNFYDYANGNWRKANPTPDSESRWGTFNILRNNNTHQLRYILEAAVDNTVAAEGTDIRKIGGFYSTGMDVEEANLLGISPIRLGLDMINNISTSYDLQNTLQHLQLHGVDAC